MSTTQEKIFVMEAFCKGEAIQFQDSAGDWCDFTKNDPLWNWELFDYRIKPIIPVECWVWVFDSGRVGSSFDSKEQAERIRIDNPSDGRLAHMKEVI
jgi:hypothetical protein